jgi:hypothetical protein
MLRYGQHHVRNGDGFLKPISELNDVPLFDEGFIVDRNEIVNEDRELDPVAPLRFGNILDLVRNTPAGAERDDDISRLHELVELGSPDSPIDEIANRGLE